MGPGHWADGGARRGQVTGPALSVFNDPRGLVTGPVVAEQCPTGLRHWAGAGGAVPGGARSLGRRCQWSVTAGASGAGSLGSCCQ